MKKFYHLIFLLSLFAPSNVFALESAEVAVVANRLVRGSVELADHYMEKRGIPKENLIRVRTTDKELCSREDYNKEIAEPVRKFLQQRSGKKPIRCLVTMFGIPLRVDPPALDKKAVKDLKRLQSEKTKVWTQLKKIEKQKSPAVSQLKEKFSLLEKSIKTLSKKEYRAAVDSELTLVMADNYSLDGWMANPFFLGLGKHVPPVGKDKVLMVSRLDGPTKETVKRIIDDSLATEVVGLKGTAYFDARWQRPKKTEKLSGYAYYDNSIHQAAARISASHRLPVVIDDRQELFQPGDAPNAALYCGWYSVSRYVDAFEWRKGAVGYHIASGECTTLRSPSSRAWCKKMLEDGVAATLGPVGEPYVQAFPPPEAFFTLLMDGSYTLVETYFLSSPFLSWQMVLIGDPLYRPFSKIGDN